VVLTDYPDKALLDNLAYNVDQNVLLPRRAAVHVVGYVWGSSVDPLLAAAQLQDTETESNADADAVAVAGPDTSNFDLILLSDLIFNHSQVRHHHYPSSSPFFPHFFSSSLGSYE
jgi:nicotinamide N-methyltransferase